MIRNSKQDWTVGKQVKVGFLTLTVQGIAAVKDSMPDIYLLNRNGTFYEFIPHNGLTKVTSQDTMNYWSKALVRS